MRQAHLLLTGLGFTLSACVVGPNYQRPPVNAPAAFRGQDAGESASFADEPWWNVYSDPHLMLLIKEALQNNYDLKAAIAHVDEARAYAGVARSAFFPAVGFETGAQLDHGVYKNQPDLDLPTSSRSKGLFLAGLSTAWEIDLWGRIRRSTEAANARYLRTEQARRGLMLSLMSGVATAYFELVELDRRLVVARNSRDAFQSTDKLFSERFGAGIASKLQVTRAEAALAAAEGTIDDVEQQIAQKENQICALVGRNPGRVDRITPRDEMTPPPVVPAGIPSQLLERRPDILEAEQNLRNASAEIGVAKANFFPRIGLTTVYGRVSTDLSSLANDSSAIGALASSLSGPIFTGGQLTNQRRAAISAYEQAKDQYAQRALGAFREVSDALVASQELADLEKQQDREVAALTESVAIANRRYLGGLASYYEVLEAQQLLYPAELALSKTSGARRLAIVELYKALGGGWNLDNARWMQGR